MFTIPALSARTATATPATTCDKPDASFPPTPATPATSVAEVAMSQVAAPPDAPIRDPASHHSVITARDATNLAGWRAALVLGRLVVCGNCNAFQFGADPAALGHCQRFDTEAAPFCPFPCEGFAPSETPTARDYLPDPDSARNWARECIR